MEQKHGYQGLEKRIYENKTHGIKILLREVKIYKEFCELKVNDYLPDGETRGLVKLRPQFVKNKSKDDFTHILIPKITVPHNESQVKVMSDYELWRVLTFPVNIRRNLITPVERQIDAILLSTRGMFEDRISETSSVISKIIKKYEDHTHRI